MLFAAISWPEPSSRFITRALKQSRYSQPAVRRTAERMAVPEARECYRSSTITDPHVLEIFAASVKNGTQSLLEISDHDILGLCLGMAVSLLLMHIQT